MSTGFTLGLEYVLLLSAEETVVDSFRLISCICYMYIYIYVYIGESNRTSGGGKLVFFLFYLFVTNCISP